MTGDLTADEICSFLQLEPNATCGFVRVTFGSKLPIAAAIIIISVIRWKCSCCTRRQ
jgi:hypothetical protein